MNCKGFVNFINEINIITTKITILLQHIVGNVDNLKTKRFESFVICLLSLER